MFSVAEAAALLEVPERLIRARARFSFFPGAREADNGTDWEIPAAGLRSALRCRVEPHWSIKSWAGLVGLSYGALYKVTAVVESLDDPLPVGKQVRAIRLELGSSAQKRIPESEILRWLGSRGRKAA